LPRHKCPLCLKVFRTISELDAHFKKNHVGKITEDGIKYCLEVGITPEQMIKHGFPEELVWKVVKESKMHKERKIKAVQKTLF